MTRTDTRPGERPSGQWAVHSGPVVVGADDTHAGRSALAWAAREAAARHVPLRLVRTYYLGLQHPWIAAEESRMTADLKESAVRIVERASQRAALLAAQLDVSTEVHAGDPVAYLVQQADRAGLIVLGARHLGVADRAVLGSVSAPVAARASCPVVVVADALGETSAPTQGKVVVGVDPWRDPGRVLEFAFDHASRHGHSLQPTMSYHVDAFADARRQYELRRVDDAKRWLAEAIAGWSERYPDVLVRPEVTHEHPVAALLGVADAQDLLVVGRHSIRARFGRLLGSTSQGVLHRAACPVAVVPTA